MSRKPVRACLLLLTVMNFKTAIEFLPIKSYKSGAHKRKAALAKKSAKKLTRLTGYFSVVSTDVRDETNHSQASSVHGGKAPLSEAAD